MKNECSSWINLTVSILRERKPQIKKFLRKSMEMIIIKSRKMVTSIREGSYDQGGSHNEGWGFSGLAMFHALTSETITHSFTL